MIFYMTNLRNFSRFIKHDLCLKLIKKTNNFTINYTLKINIRKKSRLTLAFNN